MICYEATVVDLICKFMQISNSKLWLQGKSIGNGPNSTSMNVRLEPGLGIPNFVQMPLRSYLGAKDLKTKDCALKGLELFGCTKWKLNLQRGFDCNSHLPNNVNYSIPCPNT